MWAEWLQHPCLLRVPNTGTKNGKKSDKWGKICPVHQHTITGPYHPDNTDCDS